MIGQRIGLLAGPRTCQHNAAWAGVLLVPFGVLAQAGPILWRAPHGQAPRASPG
jgi:threonine/homoserine efflux transporter RhtA